MTVCAESVENQGLDKEFDEISLKEAVDLSRIY